jgi:hypothetical protein
MMKLARSISDLSDDLLLCVRNTSSYFVRVLALHGQSTINRYAPFELALTSHFSGLFFGLYPTTAFGVTMMSDCDQSSRFSTLLRPKLLTSCPVCVNYVSREMASKMSFLQVTLRIWPVS